VERRERAALTRWGGETTAVDSGLISRVHPQFGEVFLQVGALAGADGFLALLQLETDGRFQVPTMRPVEYARSAVADELVPKIKVLFALAIAGFNTRRGRDKASRRGTDGISYDRLGFTSFRTLRIFLECAAGNEDWSWEARSWHSGYIAMRICPLRAVDSPCKANR
jgi:hypothetical protein